MSRHKYRARKTVRDGIAFPSKAEADRYVELTLLRHAGQITNLTLQPAFEILPGFTVAGKKQRPTRYVADFMYREPGRVRMVVEEVKGFETPLWKLKKKMFLYHYHETHELRVLK